MSASFIGFVLLPGKSHSAYSLAVSSMAGGSARFKSCAYRDNTSMLAVAPVSRIQTLEKHRENTCLKIACVLLQAALLIMRDFRLPPRCK
jgi:hypothetical protein